MGGCGNHQFLDGSRRRLQWPISHVGAVDWTGNSLGTGGASSGKDISDAPVVYAGALGSADGVGAGGIAHHHSTYHERAPEKVALPSQSARIFASPSLPVNRDAPFGRGPAQTPTEPA